MAEIWGWFADPLEFEFMQRALLAVVLVAIVSAVVGAFVVVRGMAIQASDNVTIDSSRYTLGPLPEAVIRDFTNGWVEPADGGQFTLPDWMLDMFPFLEDVADNSEELFEALENWTYTPDSRAPSLQAANITINADWVNLNGHIKSGIDEFDIVITQADAEQIRNTNRSSTFLLTEASQSSGVNVAYNPETGRIEVDDVIVRGGNVHIEGRIINTGDGLIDVMAGYGHINIDNQTSYALDLAELNVVNTGSGSLTIIDRRLDNGNEVRRLESYYDEEEDRFVVSRTGEDDQFFSRDELIDYSDLTFSPQQGLRYAFEVMPVNETREGYTIR
ncbi:MAG: metal ABC transporter permease, partial [Chloroflexi bacterium]|nr:metal ABC transporter permease [Chloroflexota bacterium]